MIENSIHYWIGRLQAANEFIDLYAGKKSFHGEFESAKESRDAAIAEIQRLASVTVSEVQPDAESVTVEDDFLPPWLQFDDVCEGTDGIDDSGLNEVKSSIPAPLYHGQFTRWNMHKLKGHYYSYLFGKLWFSLDGFHRLEETRPVTVTNWRQQIVDDEIRKDESA